MSREKCSVSQWILPLLHTVQYMGVFTVFDDSWCPEYWLGSENSVTLFNHKLYVNSMYEQLTPIFCHHSNLPGPLTNRWKHFRFWLRFGRVIKIFLNLPGVSYPGESISPGYHTPASQSPRGIIPRRVNCLFWILIKGAVQRNFQPVFLIWGCLGHCVMG